MSKHDPRTRMHRVPHFFTASGEKVPNTGAALAPFRLMNAGDYFDVREEDCQAGNLANLASAYSRALGSKFSMRTHTGPDGSAIHRVTLMGAKTHVDAKTGVRKLFRVERYFTQDGEPMPNTEVDSRGRPAMYPFDLMRPGEFFVVEAARCRLKAVVAEVQRYSGRTGREFKARSCPENPKRITVTRLT